MSANDQASVLSPPASLLSDAISLNGSLPDGGGKHAGPRVYQGSSFAVLVEISVPGHPRDGDLLAIAAPEGSGLRLHVETRCSDRYLVAAFSTADGDWEAFTPFHLLENDTSHFVILRYDGRRFDQFVDGLYLHLHGSPTGDALLDLAGMWAAPTTGEVLFWERFLSDDEVRQLSGGAEAVEARRARLRGRLARRQEADRAIAQADPLRPSFHFVPPVYWMNDPNGLVWWKGEFHAFYQHNPYGPYWGPMHWGHAKTTDFINWTHLPAALEPGPAPHDSDGCFSGCIVTGTGKPLAFYTGVYPECQCLAEGDDTLRNWSKSPRNPIIPSPPEGIDAAGFRDPWIWRAPDGDWRMIVGSGIRGEGGYLPLYRSSDLEEWEYLHAFITGGIDSHGTVWECPGYVQVDGRDVLIFSPEPLGKVVYFLGRVENDRFVKEAEGELDVGRNFYAPQLVRFPDGRWVVIGWLWEARAGEAQFENRWAGVLSLPRELYLDDEGRLCSRPISELEALRGRSWETANVLLGEAERSGIEAPIAGQELELEITAQGPQDSALELAIQSGPEEQTRLSYTWDGGRLHLDRSQSSRDGRADRSNVAGVLPLDPGESLRLRIFVDRSVLEIYANGCLCLTSRIYPTVTTPGALSLEAVSGNVMVESFKVWDLQRKEVH